MHFVAGGAFNGKSNWVKAFYNLDNIHHKWISAYTGEEAFDLGQDCPVILEGIELWIRDWSQAMEISEIRNKWQKQLAAWVEWEKANFNRKLVLIGSDISKGIVPIEPNDRKWRDVTGWAYQDTAAAADRVDLIWYGISKKIK